jgi:hypothetical protein
MTTRTDGPDRPGVPDPGRLLPGSTALPIEEGDEDLLEDWTPARRTNRLTAGLVVAVVAVATFTAGAYTQQHLGTSSTTNTAARAGQGFPAGQFPGGQGIPGGALPSGFPSGLPGGAGSPGGAATGTGSGRAPNASGAPSAGGAASSGAATPVVVGTITAVKGDDLVVTNFAGKAITVHVPATATVTAPGLAGAVTGMTAAVVGTKGSDGTVTATTVTARRGN